MLVSGSLHPLGKVIEPYKRDSVLCNLTDGAVKTIKFYKGLYYIRGQGGGGGGIGGAGEILIKYVRS